MLNLIKEIGRKIYFDVISGDVIVSIPERLGYVKETTIEEDIGRYTALSERNRDTFDVIELEFGQYAQDFAECNGYRVNPETKEIEFSYPDTNEEEPQVPVYRAPLSEEVDGLKQENTLLKLKVDALANHNELIEGALVELMSMILE